MHTGLQFSIGTVGCQCWTGIGGHGGRDSEPGWTLGFSATNPRFKCVGAPSRRESAPSLRRIAACLLECRGPESNWRHRHFQCRALPPELPRHGANGNLRQFGCQGGWDRGCRRQIGSSFPLTLSQSKGVSGGMSACVDIARRVARAYNRCKQPQKGDAIYGKQRIPGPGHLPVP